ncbi:DUF485 domain-containing protein [Paraburkholderia sp. CNPSo 3272]|uniref:DUF485 domain-containing protein n=1 Tax=Paraburkholderia sp. CNPSo 3272 TaxID=2940931 RepID=UPI0020B83B13|nr:DUF485 domain-containing protein [Paraburkholderia sp. CNPSo 3272]MCP3724311.1 DUF485 domain-containing protein [Paraburkholderia sp. CNPSo 3272]
MEHTLSSHGAYGPEEAALPADPPQTLIGNPRFAALVKKRRAFSWGLTALMLSAYFAFILSLAFNAKWLGMPITQGEPMTWGFPVGFGMFVFTFALVAIYVARANGVHDAMVEACAKGEKS